MRIAVLGAGAWGTALAGILHKNGHEVILWGRNAHQLEVLKQTGRHEPYLPGIELPRNWEVTTELEGAVEQAGAIVVAVPSSVFRDVTRRLSQCRGLIVSVTKGIEHESGLTMSGVLRENAPSARIAALSGPSLAYEVAREMPSAIVAASEASETAAEVQTLFHRSHFRVYTNTDVIGVELGGALKNVIAIAAGIGDGLALGDNSKAALVTRGIAEIRRLGLACGARTETFLGLGGLGDLTLTCFSRRSRNRQFGERLGAGADLQALIDEGATTVEGVPTARAAYRMARRLNVATPIINEVYAMLYEGKGLKQSIDDLMTRTSKEED